MILRPRNYGFTLVELLVVTAIVAVLTAVLYPVFRQAQESSKAAVCASNFRQASMASGLYLSDYEDKFMPVSDEPSGVANSRTDHTWVQVVLPYTKNFSVFHCPSDPTGRADVSTFDQDLVPGDTYSEFYTASLHVNTGYNYQYLAPILLQNGGWVSLPHAESEVREPSRTLLYVDSKWSLSDTSTEEGGSWLVVPPCRYAPSAGGALLDTFLDGRSAQAAFVLNAGWSGPNSGQYGGAWPWHNGRITIAHVDGSVTSETLAGLELGCDVDNNTISASNNPHSYIWNIF